MRFSALKTFIFWRCEGHNNISQLLFALAVARNVVFVPPLYYYCPLAIQ